MAHLILHLLQIPQRLQLPAQLVGDLGLLARRRRALGELELPAPHQLGQQLALERSLGVPLFHRVGKRLVLTHEGVVLRRAYADAEVRLGAALDLLAADATQVRGQVRLGLFGGFSRFRVAAVLESFLADHPETRVRTVYGSRAELADRLATGALDFTISLHAGTEATSRRVRSTRLFEQTLVLAARERPARGRDAFGTITNLPFIDHFRGEPLIDRWLRHHYGRRKLPRRNVRVWVASNTDLAVELVCRGVGSCVVPLDLVEPHRKRKELIVIGGPRAALRDDIWLNELSSARRSPLQAAFREALLAGLS